MKSEDYGEPMTHRQLAIDALARQFQPLKGAENGRD